MHFTDAVSIKDLLNTNDVRFNGRSHNCKIYLVDYESSSNRYLFLVKCFEKSSHDTGHIVSLNFDKKKKPFFDDVHCHCTCPAFIYWGVAYNSTQNGYNLEAPETRPPNVRDPQRKVKLCKHLAKVAVSLKNTSYRLLDKRAKLIDEPNKIKSAFQADYPTVPIEETFEAIRCYLEVFKKDVDIRRFLLNLNAQNFESQLLAIEAIV